MPAGLDLADGTFPRGLSTDLVEISSSPNKQNGCDVREDRNSFSARSGNAVARLGGHGERTVHRGDTTPGRPHRVDAPTHGARIHHRGVAGVERGAATGPVIPGAAGAAGTARGRIAYLAHPGPRSLALFGLLLAAIAAILMMVVLR